MKRRPKPPSGNCLLCGMWRKSLHRDHILPKFKGGADEPHNIQYICANCHEDKTREDMTGCIIGPQVRVCTPETAAKISASQKGRIFALSQKQAMSAAKIGTKQSPEHKAAIAAGRIRAKAARVLKIVQATTND